MHIHVHVFYMTAQKAFGPMDSLPLRLRSSRATSRMPTTGAGLKYLCLLVGRGVEQTTSGCCGMAILWKPVCKKLTVLDFLWLNQ